MGEPTGLLEDLETTERCELGYLLDVRLTATSLAWLNLPLTVGEGLLLGLLQPGLRREERPQAVLEFALAGLLTNGVHALGHILSGHLVGAPMDELIITATRLVNRYEGEQTAYPPSVHLGRALGGPAANLALAGLLALVARVGPPPGRSLAGRLCWLNLGAGLLALLPLPSVDGEVIWGTLTGGQPDA